jgi:anti-sigma regulatory factor (Ser/Thr protein kinase)
VAETNQNQYFGSFNIEGGNFNSAGIVSTTIKSTLKNLGIPGDLVRKAAIVSYEAEINVVSYAKKGVVNLTVNPGVVNIEVIDEGPGIPNIDLAMQEGWSTADNKIREMGFGAGMGLSNIKACSDQMVFDSKVGVGTRLEVIIRL